MQTLDCLLREIRLFFTRFKRLFLRDELINVVKDSLDGSIKEVINNELESLRVEFTGYVTDFKVQIKNELAVLRQSVTDSLDADQTARNIEKDDVRKLQSRLDSTCDKFQHASQQIKDLQGRINILENSNAALRKQIELLEKKVIDTPQDESCGESPIVSSTESPDLPAPTEEVVTSAHGSQTAPLTNNPAEFTSAHGSQAAPLTNNPAEFAGTHGSQPTFKNDPTDIAILMDSNRKFLDPTKLCCNQNVQIIPCGNIQSAKSIISESRLKNPQILVFNTGVNDVEGTDDASTIAKNLLEVISITRAQFPTCKIVVCEITSRYDELNTKVEQANTQLRSALENIENVFIVSHENLNEKRCFYDAKHLSRTIGIPKLASNLVRGIRRARGLNPRLKRRKPKS